MDPRAEQFVESAKAGLVNVHKSLKYSPNHWRNCTSTVKTCISYIDQSRIMHDPRRIEERTWIITEIQNFAYFDADAGGVPDVAPWCEREWNRLLNTDPYQVVALTGQGNLWLSKAQYYLSQIHQQERAYRDVDDLTAERRCNTPDYVEARNILQASVDFFSRAVESARVQGRITGSLLEKIAEAFMSLGNVSTAKAGRIHFKEAVRALQAANAMGHHLPRHMQQWLRENGRYC